MASTGKDRQKSVLVRMTDEDHARLKYWAASRNMSISEYIVYAMNRLIDIENGNYDLPKLEIQRLNQLIDTITVLSSNVASLEAVTVHGFDSLLGLTKGANYLLDEDENDG